MSNAREEYLKEIGRHITRCETVVASFARDLVEQPYSEMDRHGDAVILKIAELRFWNSVKHSLNTGMSAQWIYDNAVDSVLDAASHTSKSTNFVGTILKHNFNAKRAESLSILQYYAELENEETK